MNGLVTIGILALITLVAFVQSQRPPDRPLSINETDLSDVVRQRVPVSCRLDRGKWRCGRRETNANRDQDRARDRTSRRKFSYRILSDTMNATEPTCMPGLEGLRCDEACFNCSSFERLEKRLQDIETRLVNGGQRECDCPPGPPGLQGEPGYPGRIGRPGPVGPQGPAGPTGKRGPPGPVSYKDGLLADEAQMRARPFPTDIPKFDPSMFRGPEGERGPRGYSGSPGDPGVPGALGPPGPPGGQGPVGPQGRPGPQGPFGPPGPKGALGDEGVTGPPGPAGQRGEPGFPGPAGIAGPPGRQGEPGMPGDIGQQGDIGPKGDRGDSGIPGQGGQRGRRGFRGPRGVMGRQGVPGTPGEAGSPGVPGRSGMPGTPGRPGLPGEPGPQGPAGLPGRPGSIRYQMRGKGEAEGGLTGNADDEVLQDINDLMDRLATMPEFQRLHRNIEGINREFVAAANDLKIKVLSVESRVTFLEDKIHKMELIANGGSPETATSDYDYSVPDPDAEGSRTTTRAPPNYRRRRYRT